MLSRNGAPKSLQGRDTSRFAVSRRTRGFAIRESVNAARRSPPPVLVDTEAPGPQVDPEAYPLAAIGGMAYGQEETGADAAAAEAGGQVQSVFKKAVDLLGWLVKAVVPEQ
ncbi:unnamed protein product [Peniophora sp. CBMAI 1063]|nr:unnamed protein product [Peniophora sp. CBMAI 1063]